MIDRDFRLPKTIRPTRYAIRIDADLERWQFSATESIELSLREPASEILLHAVDLRIESARVSASGRTQTASVSVHADAEAIGLRLPQPVSGAATVEIAFGGEILERLRGFYRSQKDGRRYAATQFEAADARRAFPCFDEPEFKARFQLTLVIPADAVAVSNAPAERTQTLPDGRQEVVFAETPPISSYLVAYCIGPFEATPAESTPSGVPVRVWLPHGMADKGVYAREAHQRSLTWLEQYTRIPYAYAKVDAIGLPDFEAGAMENPGAITYRLTAIAADPQRASTNALKGIFYTAAHELTHMWWGDLVTMAWWNDLWLNESFATFVGYKTVAELMPEWGLWRDFVATLARPFALDALVSTHPISFEVKNAKQATERFDVITYWKGAGVVRMIEGFLGAEAFRDGVHSYLQRYREGNATADDFWRELTNASGQDVAGIANPWITAPGHPLIHCSGERVGGGLRLQLQQERFYADPQAAAGTAAQRWPVPLVIKHGSGSTAQTQRVLLTDAAAAITLPDATWYFPNAGASGFYRFTMDDSAVRALVPVLQEALLPHERLALADNYWALLKGGAVDIAPYLNLLRGYQAESDRAVVAVITDQLGWLSVHAVADATRAAFEQFVAGYYQPAFARMGWEAAAAETADERMKRAAVIAALGGIARVEAIRTEARRRLERYLQDRASLDPNLVSTVVGLAARDGDAELYERYLEHRRAATTDPEEEQRFLLALAAFEHPDLIQRTLQLAVSPVVRAQDRTFLFAGLLGRRSARAAAWEFVRRRWDDLAALLDPMLLQGLIRALGQLTDEPAATEVRDFLAPRATDQSRETIAQVSEHLRIDAATVQRLQSALPQALRRLA